VPGGFTVLTIIAFGILTLVLHQEMLRGAGGAGAGDVYRGCTGQRAFWWLLSSSRTRTGRRGNCSWSDMRF
jgi:hypothetical protein